MGKRKSSKKPQPKASKMKPLDKTFRCLFCQHMGTVFCKMDKREASTGYLECTNCGQKFSSTITALSEPIDVYSDWIDASEAANRPVARGDIDEEDDEEELAREERRAAPPKKKRRTDDYEEDLDAEGEEEERRPPPRREPSLNAYDYDSDNLPEV